MSTDSIEVPKAEAPPTPGSAAVASTPVAPAVAPPAAEVAAEPAAVDPSAAATAALVELEAKVQSRLDRIAALESRLEAREAAALAVDKAEAEAALSVLPEAIQALAPKDAAPDALRAWAEQAAKLQPAFARGGLAAGADKPAAGQDFDAPEGVKEFIIREAKRYAVEPAKWWASQTPKRRASLAKKHGTE